MTKPRGISTKTYIERLKAKIENLRAQLRAKDDCIRAMERLLAQRSLRVLSHNLEALSPVSDEPTHRAIESCKPIPRESTCRLYPINHGDERWCDTHKSHWPDGSRHCSAELQRIEESCGS